MEGKVALVTGGASGIGAKTVEFLARDGFTVIASDRNIDGARSVATRHGALALALDVSVRESWLETVAVIGRRHGRLDALVNCAGIFDVATIADTSTEFFERMIAINQMGPFYGIQSCTELMAKGGGGAIVNLSSVAGLIGRPGVMAYSTVKWALRGMTKVAATELAPRGIRVNSVHPGSIETPMLLEFSGDTSILGDPLPVPMKRMGRPEEIAEMIAFLVSDRSSYCTGAEFVCDGGMMAL